MVVDDFDIVSVSIDPAEANPPLVVDPNGKCPLSVASQGLRSIAGRHPEIFQTFGGMKPKKLSPCGSFAIGEAAYPLVEEQPFRIAVSERSDHRA